MLKQFMPESVLRWNRRRKWIAALRTWTTQDEKMKQFYAQFVRPGDLVFDVGANVGNRSKVFLALGADVVAIEPQPYCVSALRSGLGGQAKLQLVQSAVGAKPGKAKMQLSEATTISSMSEDWIAAVKKTGRFGDKRWDETIEVEVTTLDTLIERFGPPVFAKIDVEGFEKEVLAGLSRPIDVISLEYTFETQHLTHACFDRLESIAELEFNLSSNETMQLDMPNWVNRRELVKAIDERVSREPGYFGDIYVRMSPIK